MKRQIIIGGLLVGAALLASCGGGYEDSFVPIDPFPTPTPEVNANANAPIEGKAYVTDLCMPCINTSQPYVEHVMTLKGEKMLNFALQWDDAVKHARWVAFSFDKSTAAISVKRQDAWDVDPQLPREMRTTDAMHKSDGFDRGHLVASYDRVCSAEANKQTFYFSNITPQLHDFNGGYWASFENVVQQWARSNRYDKLYVTKGGTTGKLLANYTADRKGADGVLPQTDAKGLTKHGIGCPKYYFIAVLAVKDTVYQSIGFWIEHRDDYGYSYDNFAPVSVVQKHIVSIDELEKQTGLDLFCNLPDKVENRVEAIADKNLWIW